MSANANRVRTVYSCILTPDNRDVTRISYHVCLTPGCLMVAVPRRKGPPDADPRRATRTPRELQNANRQRPKRKAKGKARHINARTCATAAPEAQALILSIELLHSSDEAEARGGGRSEGSGERSRSRSCSSPSGARCTGGTCDANGSGGAKCGCCCERWGGCCGPNRSESPQVRVTAGGR